MSTSVNGSGVRNHVVSFHPAATLKPHSAESSTSRSPEITAVSIEFVAKPHEAKRLAAIIPDEILRTLKHVHGFAGCLVMISDQEALLVTVVTFWDGEDCVKRRSQNLCCVQALLAPYLDRRLRVQTMVAHLPVLPMMRTETVSTNKRSAMPDRGSNEENIHVAS